MSALQNLMEKSQYEDELGLYDVEGDVLPFWTTDKYLCIAATDKETIDFLEETIKKLLARNGISESESPSEGLDVNEALDMIEHSGIKTNTIERDQIHFALYQLKYFMKDEKMYAPTAKAIRSAAVSTIRKFFRNVDELPGGLKKEDLMFHIQINDGGEKRDPYFVVFIEKKPGIEELFHKAFTADLDVDEEGWCIKFDLPQEYLREALNEFMMNA